MKKQITTLGQVTLIAVSNTVKGVYSLFLKIGNKLLVSLDQGTLAIIHLAVFKRNWFLKPSPSYPNDGMCTRPSLEDAIGL